MTCGIYKIVNVLNGKIYIGQSTNIEKRWKNHKHMSRTAIGHLYRAMRKDSLDNFLFEVVVECDEHMLDEFEIGIIKLYDTTNPEKGYNKTFGGEGGKKTDETRKKMSDAKKGKPKSDEIKTKISDAKKNMTDETKQKISESQKGNSKALKQYQYQGNIYNGKQELADFLGTHYNTLASRISRKQIDVIIIPNITKINNSIRKTRRKLK